MPDLTDNYEGYDPNASGGVIGGARSWEQLARYGVKAWVDSAYLERVGGDTTGDRVTKGGYGPRVNTATGQVATSAQRDGSAVDNGPTVAGISVGSLLLFGLIAGGLYLALE